MSAKREQALRDALNACIPWVAASGRGAAQQALIGACFAVGSDPWNWTAHPKVLEQRLALMPVRYRRAYQRRVASSPPPQSSRKQHPAAPDGKEKA